MLKFAAPEVIKEETESTAWSDY